MDDFWGNTVVISRYTRAQAVADGVLVDATEEAREVGFLHPLVLSSAAWDEAVTWAPGNKARQIELARLWDVLTTARDHIQRGTAQGATGDRGRFQVLRIPNTPHATVARPLELDIHVGPGDDAAPVLTIMLPGED